MGKRFKDGLGVALVTGMLALGCATSFPPPQELVNARVAYARASQGPAAQVAVSRLRLAKQALDSAEMAYGGKPEDEVRNRSYVALRRIQAAEAEAGAAIASQRRQKALEELATLQGVYADQARAQIAAERGRANSAEAEAGAANQRASAEQTRASAEQTRADSAEQRAAAEKQARLAAEEKANQAITELAHVATVRRETRGLVITLSGQVLFASNDATLLPAASAALDNVVAALKAMPSNAGKVTIEGHTDSRGAPAYNRDLAQRRANAVRQFLVSRGVSGDVFVVNGIGPDRPVATNMTAEGRANNRRVEIVLPAPAFPTATETTTSVTVTPVRVPTAIPAPTPAATPPAPATTTTTTTTIPAPAPAPAPVPAPAPALPTP